MLHASQPSMSDKMLEYITNQQTGVKTVWFCSHILSANQSTVQQEVRNRLGYTDNYFTSLFGLIHTSNTWRIKRKHGLFVLASSCSEQQTMERL